MRYLLSLRFVKTLKRLKRILVDNFLLNDDECNKCSNFSTFQTHHLFINHPRISAHDNEQNQQSLGISQSKQKRHCNVWLTLTFYFISALLTGKHYHNNRPFKMYNNAKVYWLMSKTATIDHRYHLASYC